MKIVLATNNENKVNEYRFLFKDTKIKILSLNDLNLKVEVEETGQNYKENALLKAKAVAKLTKEVVLSDDSGLEICALDKFPGYASSRYAKHNKSQEEANRQIINLMAKKRRRRAYFIAYLAIYNLKDKPLIFKAKARGDICHEERGKDGFGYDPLFFIKKVNKTYAELTLKEKSLYSHRGLVTKKFLKYLKRQNLK